MNQPHRIADDDQLRSSYVRELLRTHADGWLWGQVSGFSGSPGGFEEGVMASPGARLRRHKRGCRLVGLKLGIAGRRDLRGVGARVRPRARRADPDRVDAQPRQVVEASADTRQISDSVAARSGFRDRSRGYPLPVVRRASGIARGTKPATCRR